MTPVAAFVPLDTASNVRLWPKAAIRTESKWVLLNGCFGEKSGHSDATFQDLDEWPRPTADSRGLAE